MKSIKKIVFAVCTLVVVAGLLSACCHTCHTCAGMAPSDIEEEE